MPFMSVRVAGPRGKYDIVCCDILLAQIKVTKLLMDKVVAKVLLLTTEL